MFGKRQKQANKTNKRLAGGVVHNLLRYMSTFVTSLRANFQSFVFKHTLSEKEQAKEEVKAGLFLFLTDRVETH